MPRFKPKGVLERTAVDDLWKHTLSRIPTVFGRLAYLASLRDSHSGAYRHHGLTGAFGRDESVKAMRDTHEQAFVGWIGLNMKEKYGVLGQYLDSLEDPAPMVVEHWLVSRVYRTFVPASAGEMERSLFCSDLGALLEMIRDEAAATAPASLPLR
jgi:hypothetical protein